MTPLATSINPNWKVLLRRSLEGILEFSEDQGPTGLKTKGKSRDGRTLLEFLELDGKLSEAELQMALPQPYELEMLKLTCWSLLYLKSLFPNWIETEGWVKSAAQWASETGLPIEEHFDGYRVVCWHDPNANVVGFQVLTL